MNTDRPCPFCALPDHRVLQSNEYGIAFLDGFPITEGHTLVIPRRHVACLFDLPAEELSAVWNLVETVRADLAAKYHPDGFNVGLNDGAAAGQTIGHAHIHVIPRRAGDVPDPRGGVRWIIPDKAIYWDKS